MLFTSLPVSSPQCLVRKVAAIHARLKPFPFLCPCSTLPGLFRFSVSQCGVLGALCIGCRCTYYIQAVSFSMLSLGFPWIVWVQCAFGFFRFWFLRCAFLRYILFASTNYSLSSSLFPRSARRRRHFSLRESFVLFVLQIKSDW